MLRATAEANNLSALASAQEKYTEHMDKVKTFELGVHDPVNPGYIT